MSMDMNKLMQQAAADAGADRSRRRRRLENEVVEASAGGGMVTVKATGAGEILEIKITPEAIDPDDPEVLEDLVLAAVNEALRSASRAREVEAKLEPRLDGLGLERHVEAAPGPGRAHASDRPRHCARRTSDRGAGTMAQVSQPGGRQPRRAADAPARRSGSGRRSGSRSTSSRCRRTRRSRSREAIAEVKERVRFCRECGNLTEEERLRDLPRRAARPHADLRRRAAGRPHLARAHARVPRPLPRARRRALAARRRRAGAPAHRRAAAARRAERRPGGRARDEPEHDGRGDRRATSPTACAAACASRGSRAGCRSAATSSTPTR